MFECITSSLFKMQLCRDTDTRIPWIKCPFSEETKFQNRKPHVNGKKGDPRKGGSKCSNLKHTRNESWRIKLVGTVQHWQCTKSILLCGKQSYPRTQSENVMLGDLRITVLEGKLYLGRFYNLSIFGYCNIWVTRVINFK